MPPRSLAAFAVLACLSTLPAQLSGTYTINPAQPASATNFTSLADATLALLANGVSGPVDLLLYDDAGPYTEAATFTSAVWTPNTAVLSLTSWSGASAVNRVTFKPAPGEHVVFDATGRSMGVFWGGADYVTLQGIEIENALVDAISLYAEVFQGVAQDPIIDGCTLHDCAGAGVTIYGNVDQPSNTLVKNCVMYRLQQNHNTTGNVYRAGYVSIRRSNGTRIVHNTFVVDGSLLPTYGAVIAARPANSNEEPFTELSNNIVVKSSAAANPVIRIQSPSSTTAPLPSICDSNCFHDTSGGPFAHWGVNAAAIAPTLASWQANAMRDLASIQGDPMFHDAAAHDYHLHATSPCRGASTVVAGVAVDVDRQPRVGPIDLGADEFSAGERTYVGVGCAGTGGSVPVVTSSWPFLGNLQLAVHTAGAPPGLLTVLFGSLGLSPSAIPFGAGCTIYLDPSSAVSVGVAVASPGGTSSFVFSVPASPSFVGVNIAYESLVLDPGAPLGLTLSNAVDLVFDF